jgi:hypothetical protein
MLTWNQNGDIYCHGLLLEVSANKRSELHFLLDYWRPLAQSGTVRQTAKMFLHLRKQARPSCCLLTAQTSEILVKSRCSFLDTEQKEAPDPNKVKPLIVACLSYAPDNCCTSITDGISSWQVAVYIAGRRNAGDNPFACFPVKQNPFSVPSSCPRIPNPQDLSIWYMSICGRQDFW